MKTAVPFACFLSIIRPPGVQYENALLQIAPVDKSKCPFIKDKNDVGFQLFTRHNPIVYQELMVEDDEKLFASSIDFNDRTVLYFHAFMEQPDDGSGIMVREALMQRGDTNVIMVDASRLEAGPWYFTAAHNTWYIGQFAARFIDYLVTRGLNLNTTQFVGHSLGAQAAGVAGGHLKTGRVARITGLDPALPLFDHVSLEERLDPSDAHFVDVIHTDAGIFGYPSAIGHADFYPNGGKSPQPGCELEVVIPQHLLLNKCDARIYYVQGFYTYHMQSTNQKAIQNYRDMLSSTKNQLHKLSKERENTRDITDRFSHIQNKIQELVRSSGDDIDQLSQTKNKLHRPVRNNIDELSQTHEIQLKLIKNNINDQVSQIQNRLHGLVRSSSDSTDSFSQKDNQRDKSVRKETNKYEDYKSHREQKCTNNGHHNLITTSLGKEFTKSEKAKLKRNAENILAFSNKHQKNSMKDPEFNHQTSIKQAVFDRQLTNHLVKETRINNKLTTDQKLMRAKVSKGEFTLQPDLDADLNFNSELTRHTDYKNDLHYNDKLISPVTSQDIQPRKKRFTPTYKATDASNNALVDHVLTRHSDYNKDLTRRLNYDDEYIISQGVKSRTKRFAQLPNFSEPSNNALFRLFSFLLKNRVPILSFMREINTIAKSANGEFSHFSKESYIGSMPPFTSYSYALEMGGGNRLLGLLKKVLGFGTSDRLTVSSS